MEKNPRDAGGMLDFLREGSPELFDNVAVSFLPLVNLSGLSAGCRLNSTGQNPNRGFTNGAEVEPSVEGKVLLNYEALLKNAARHGVLCCHEDILRQQAYLYTFEHTARPGHFSVALRDELERFFPVMEKERVDGCECEDGIIFNHFDSSFESWLYSSGSDVAACTETPGLQPFAKRAEANRYLIGAFISSILERNSIGGRDVMKPLLLTNALIISEDMRYQADILIDKGRIQKIASFIPSRPEWLVIDVRGKWVIPGMIDDQVHFREPGLTHKGTIATESAAAVMGGITSFMEMPNVTPPTTTRQALREKFQRASRSSLANHSFYFGATNDNLDELKALTASQACGVKVFMGGFYREYAGGR
ncbi:amidohydrolase family protein [Klebsiella pneumoniae]|nr:amidohydrolase family protein [Klebsiella pneumoniae]